MPKPACAKCQLFLKPIKNGVFVEECAPEEQPDGTETWQPYKIWMADVWGCEGCEARIVTGYGQNSVVEHYEADYGRIAEKVDVRIKDC